MLLQSGEQLHEVISALFYWFAICLAAAYASSRELGGFQRVSDSHTLCYMGFLNRNPKKPRINLARLRRFRSIFPVRGSSSLVLVSICCLDGPGRECPCVCSFDWASRAATMPVIVPIVTSVSFEVS